MEIKELIEEFQSGGYTLTDICNISKKINRPLALSTLSTLVNAKRHGSFRSYQSLIDIKNHIDMAKSKGSKLK